MGIMNYIISFIPLLMFILSILGIIINRKNIILILICIEIMLLSISLNILFSSFIINNIYGQILVLYLLTVAAIESAIGLSIIISFYKLKGSISIKHLNLMKG